MHIVNSQLWFVNLQVPKSKVNKTNVLLGSNRPSIIHWYKFSSVVLLAIVSCPIPLCYSTILYIATAFITGKITGSIGEHQNHPLHVIARSMLSNPA